MDPVRALCTDIILSELSLTSPHLCSRSEISISMSQAMQGAVHQSSHAVSVSLVL